MKTQGINWWYSFWVRVLNMGLYTERSVVHTTKSEFHGYGFISVAGGGEAWQTCVKDYGLSLKHN